MQHLLHLILYFILHGRGESVGPDVNWLSSSDKRDTMVKNLLGGRPCGSWNRCSNDLSSCCICSGTSY
jgi:hypothetical protein